MTSSMTGTVEIDAPVVALFGFVSGPHRRTPALARAVHAASKGIADRCQTATKDVDEITVDPTEAGAFLTRRPTISPPITLLTCLVIRVTAQGRQVAVATGGRRGGSAR